MSGASVSRTHRRNGEILVGLAVGCLCAGVVCDAGAGWAGSAPRASCGLAGSRTLRATREVRIFEWTGQSDTVVYGCAYATGRRHRLGLRGGPFEDKVTLYSIAGTNVAYLSGYFGEDFPHFFLYVKDVATGKTRYAVDEERPRKVVLHRSGAVAWTTTTCLWDSPTPVPGAARFPDDCRYVVKADARGARVLESSRGIELRSIRLDRRTVRWRSRSRERSYVLQTRRG